MLQKLSVCLLRELLLKRVPLKQPPPCRSTRLFLRQSRGVRKVLFFAGRLSPELGANFLLFNEIDRPSHHRG